MRPTINLNAYSRPAPPRGDPAPRPTRRVRSSPFVSLRDASAPSLTIVNNLPVGPLPAPYPGPPGPPGPSGTFPASGGVVITGPADLINWTANPVAGVLTIDRSRGENVIVPVAANITAVRVTGWPVAGVTGKVRLIIGNQGNFTITGWPLGTRWPGGVAPTITQGVGNRDIILLMSDDAGASIYASVVGQDYF